MKDHNINPKEKEKLLASLLLWDDYGETFWEKESDAHTRGLAGFLKKSDPALFNFFERKIVLNEGVPGQEVDLTYF
ncbi:hypothetical protein, partial [Paenibacillus sp. Leaf72]|uniref:hypothetical protein n=1 Tax=Paenibacillus sp. Leaf72 TaxID=1736234 RepID=UPI001F3B36C2